MGGTNTRGFSRQVLRRKTRTGAFPRGLAASNPVPLQGASKSLAPRLRGGDDNSIGGALFTPFPQRTLALLKGE
jgi:hypothetical protein